MTLLDKWYGKVDAALMKQIAVAAMFIDHATLSFLEVARNEEGVRIMNTFAAGKALDEIGRGIGRLAFPVFCFMIVEGFFHTRDRWRYLIRLLICAAVSQLPFCLLVFPESTKPHADTIFTLTIGYVLIWCIDTLRRKLVGDGKLIGEEKMTALRAARLAVLALLGGGLTYAACMLALWRGCDYKYGGVICILILYLFYDAREWALTLAWLWLSYYNHNEILAITGFALIWCYNEKRGRQKKYFFYLFYPGHLLLLYLIRKAIWGI